MTSVSQLVRGVGILFDRGGENRVVISGRPSSIWHFGVQEAKYARKNRRQDTASRPPGKCIIVDRVNWKTRDGTENLENFPGVFSSREPFSPRRFLDRHAETDCTVYTHAHTQSHNYTNTDARIHVQTCTHTQIHTYIRTNTDTHTHTHVRTQLASRCLLTRQNGGPTHFAAVPAIIAVNFCRTPSAERTRRS